MTEASSYDAPDWEIWRCSATVSADKSPYGSSGCHAAVSARDGLSDTFKPR